MSSRRPRRPLQRRSADQRWDTTFGIYSGNSHRVFDLNTKGAYFLMEEVVSIMPDGGSIILMSSIAHAMAMANNSVYAASKAALRSMVRTFAGASIFLASDGSAYVTGVDLPVDGGVLAIGFV